MFPAPHDPARAALSLRLAAVLLSMSVSTTAALADTEPPVLVSLQPGPTDLVAGDVLRVRVTATDETGIASISAIYVSPGGNTTFPAFARGPIVDSADLELPVTATMQDGVHRLYDIYVRDTVTPRPNLTCYNRDNLSGCRAHGLDFSIADFTVRGNEVNLDRGTVSANGIDRITVTVTPQPDPGPFDILGEPDPHQSEPEWDVVIATSLGELIAGDRQGLQVRALDNGDGRYTAELRSAEAGTARLEVRINGRLLPPSLVQFDAFAHPTTTTLSAPATVLAGEGVALTATVAGADGTAAGTPSGTVSFRRDGIEVASRSLNAAGTANAWLQDVLPGSYSFSAHYQGNSDHAASASGPVSVTVAPRNVHFVGGGVVFGQTAQCGPVLGSAPHGVTVSYSPAELNGLPSGVSIVWRDGAEHLALWGPVAPSGDEFFGGAGRSTWTRFVFAPTRPLIRVVSRRVTEPSSCQLRGAHELVLRLRVQNFATTPGCSVTLVATLRRDPFERLGPCDVY